MNARIQTIVPAFGTLIEGGFYHGLYQLGDEIWGEVTAPKAEGETTGLVWHNDYTDIAGACSDFDGLANTIAMADAGSPLAQWAREQRIGGFDDWFVTARAGLQLQLSNLQPVLLAAEKFDPVVHVSSTQFDSYDAYYQYFGYGGAGILSKSWKGRRARLVRRFRVQ